MQEYDLVWKEILNLLLKDFTEFFWFAAYRDIDWDIQYEILEQELHKVAVKDEIGNLYVDKLFKVFLKNGKEQWLLLHIEIQHSKQADFPKRMLTYFTRLHSKYNKNIASMAVLADSDPNWRPNKYEVNIWNSVIFRSYKVVKILDYLGKEEMLRRTENPFGLIVLAQLATIATKPNEEARLISKTQLIRYLLAHKWSSEKIKNMCFFIENLLVLNNELEDKYVEQVRELEEDNSMPLFLPGERAGFRRGEAYGMAHGIAHVLTTLLQTKFQDVPAEYLDKVKSADTATLDAWAINFVHAQTIDEVFKE